MIVNFFHNLSITFVLMVFYFQFPDSRYLFLIISIIRDLTYAQGSSTSRTVWVSVIWITVRHWRWRWFLLWLLFFGLFYRLFYRFFNHGLRICVNLLINLFIIHLLLFFFWISLFILTHFYIIITQVFHSFFK